MAERLHRPERLRTRNVSRALPDAVLTPIGKVTNHPWGRGDGVQGYWSLWRKTNPVFLGDVPKPVLVKVHLAARLPDRPHRASSSWRA